MGPVFPMPSKQILTSNFVKPASIVVNHLQVKPATMSSETPEHPLLDDVVEKLFETHFGMGRNTWMSHLQTTTKGADQVNVPNGKEPPPGFEYAEHGFLGDRILLTDDKGAKFGASMTPITILGSGDNTQPLTYGEISALAGDFYGTSNPISDGKDDTDRHKRFIDALNTLVDNPKNQPQDAKKLIDYLQKEIDAVQEAVDKGLDPSTVYKGKEVVSNYKLELMTRFRKGFPSYLVLALINWDHFGDDARTAYQTGHLAALNHAASDDTSKTNLFEAYSMNAFADHFLQDLFSSGHMRTPRRQLHGGTLYVRDKCAQFMHDEDSALGLQVTDQNNESWTAYGDRRLLDKDDHDNLKRCLWAVQASADEVYLAWKTKEVPNPSKFEAWRNMPSKASVLATGQPLSPLFLLGPLGTYDDLQRRANIDDRRTWKHTTDWWAATTWNLLRNSKRWDYPMTF